VKFKNSVISYLEGELFSNGLTVGLEGDKQSQFDRIAILKELCSAKKIIHLGCADHLDLIDSKIKHNIWLHKILDDSADKCIGIDINEQAIEYLRTNYKQENVFAGNILDMPLDIIRNEKWDYIVLGEIIEHVDNPVQFLSDLHTRLKPLVKALIITAPNAWSSKILSKVRQNTETINSDHRYWFTPYTLAKVLVRAGYKVEDILFSYFSMPKRNLLKAYFKKKHFLQADSIIIKASF